MSELAIGVERLTALVFIVTGLSHLAAPRLWARFFVAMRERSAVPGFGNAFVHIPLGLLIVSFHWLWSWPAIVFTLVGCSLALKGTLYFTFPGLAARSMAHVDESKPWPFRAAGLVALGFGLWLGWLSLGAPSVRG